MASAEYDPVRQQEDLDIYDYGQLFEASRGEYFLAASEGYGLSIAAPKGAHFVLRATTDDYRFSGFGESDEGVLQPILGVPREPMELAFFSPRIVAVRGHRYYFPGREGSPEPYVPFDLHGIVTLMLGRTAFCALRVERCPDATAEDFVRAHMAAEDIPLEDASQVLAARARGQRRAGGGLGRFRRRR